MKEDKCLETKDIAETVETEKDLIPIESVLNDEINISENKKDKKEVEEPTEELANEETGNRKKNHSKKKKIIVGIIIGVLVIALGALGFWYYQQGSEIKKALELGEQYLNEDNYEDANIAFDKAIAIDDKKSEAYEGKGDAYIGLKDFSQAEEYIKKAQDIKKSTYNIVQMADVFANTNRVDEANKMVNEIANIEKEKTKTVVRVAQVLTITKEYENAIKMIENKIAGTTDKNELIKLFDRIIDVYVVSGKSEDELLTLLERAADKTGDKSYIDRKESVVVKLPSFEPAEGEYETSVVVTVKKGNDNDRVYYTLDGSDPTNQSVEYTNPIELGGGNHRVKVVECNQYGTKGKIQKTDYTVKINPKEAFKRNIEGNWHTRYNGPNPSTIYESVVTFSGDTFSEMSGIAGVGEGGGGKYRILSVNDDGTKGTIELYDQGGPRAFPNLTTIDIDCGAMGDGVIKIGKSNYSFTGN